MLGVRFRRVHGIRVSFQRFYALLVKHAIHSRRNLLVTIVQLALPVVFTIIACVVEKTVLGPEDPPSLPLSLSYFSEPIVALAVDSALSASGQRVVSGYRSSGGQFATVRDTGGQYMDMDRYLLEQAKNLASYNRHYIVAGSQYRSCDRVELTGLYEK